MELILVIIGLIVVCYLIASVVRWLSNTLKDKAARDALADFDFDKEKEEIKSIGSKYISSEYRCPRCNGLLIPRVGPYGGFLGCNHYPECRYTRNIQ